MRLDIRTDSEIRLNSVFPQLGRTGRFSLSVVELDASGNLLAQHAYNNVAGGSPTSSVQPLSIIQTHDSGYAVAGTFNSTTGAGTCCSGPLFLKLDAQGAIQLQQAYEGGVYCFFNGLGEQCNSIGGIAYAVQQNKDGGFVLAGASNIEMRDGTPLEPWLARVDASGALIWEENDYRVNPQTGRLLSEYFAGVAMTSTGFFALGATENYSNGQGELFGVSTDGDGHVSLACADEHSTALLAAADPGLVDLAPQASPSPARPRARAGRPSRRSRRAEPRRRRSADQKRGRRAAVSRRPSQIFPCNPGASWLEASEEARRTLSCLFGRSSRPHRSPQQLAPELEEVICECRRRTGWGPRLVAGATGFAHSTVWKVLRRADISRPPKRAKEPATTTSGRAPGDLLHMARAGGGRCVDVGDASSKAAPP